jgi:hypothetical protein
LLIALESTPIAMDLFYVLLCLPVLLMVWAVIGLWTAGRAACQLRRRAWKRAIISAVLPMVVLSVGLNPIAFIRFCNNAGETIHFYVNYPSYMRAVHATPPNGQPKLLTFNLGGMSWASRGFVYDGSDEIMQEPSMQSSSWKARAQNSELGCGYGAIPIPGPYALSQHWYLASFAC